MRKYMKKRAIFPDLSGKSVFVTGGGSGIGAALTEGFLAQGARVAFVQRSDGSDFVARMEEAYDNRLLFMPCDISDVEALKRCMAQAAQAHGTLSVLVNNAANDTRHTLADTSLEDWERGMAINLRPHFFTCQAVAEGMRTVGGGAIINFSSISYMMGNSGYPGYVAAKAGITGLTRALARELGGDNIRVNALMPGWVLTDRQVELWATPKDLEAHLERQCLKEHLKPEDIVDATLFLASDASRMMTGQALVVDGGVVVTG
jgi:NAD(P)-dependent dehydrogenase (short-subunit alcohol dehydrogenase family)